jgi:hypothetical protein
LPGIALTLLPAIRHCLSLSGDKHETAVLASIIVPLAYVNYVYAMASRLPVGFVDVHVHLVHTLTVFDSSGHLDFSRAQTISFNFVGLYVLARSFSLVTSIGLVGVAVALPPAINLSGILVIYLVMRRLLPLEIAQLAIIFVGWENTVILYGSGFITQTPAFLMIFLALYSYVTRRTGDSSQTGMTVVTIAALMALATFSFASTVVGLVLFTTISILNIGWTKSRSLEGATYVLFLGVFFLTYTLYISSSPGVVLGKIVVLFREALASQSVGAPNTGQEIYGPIVRGFAYFFWTLFAVLFPFFITWHGLRRRPVTGIVFLACGSILGTGILLSNAVGFSLGRTYEVGLILISIVVASGLLRAVSKAKGHTKLFVKAAVCVVVVLFVATSVAKFPAYIAGGAAPLRGHEPIDDVPYWSTGQQAFWAARFLEMRRQGARIYPEVLIQVYPILEACDKFVTCLPPYFGSGEGFVFPQTRAGDLTLLENAFNGNTYTYRNLLPPASSFSASSLVYENGDYQLYLAH